ncbi:DUF4129 domain-containing protein [Mycolicibacterium vaccae]|uniref:DUF4129 domain-containing protein n=1 Tax=Mycolicibacterium vaccae TaxID=1810 RepID=UPI003CE82484
MPGDGKATTRTVVVLAALLLSALALRGYLPAEQAGAPAPREPERSESSPTAVLALFAVALAIMAFSALARPRRRRSATTGESPRRDGGPAGRPPWRVLLYVAAGLVAWLALILLLQRWDVAVPEGDASAGDAPPSGGGADSGADPAAQSPPETGGPDHLFGYVLAATIAMVALSLVAGVRARRPRVAAQPPFDAADPSPVRPRGPDLARAAELGLAEIGDRSRDPREAIIACYAAMESELEKSPNTSPQASDTPSEVLARAVARRVLRAGSAAELVDLFEEARFSGHVMTEQHRDDALHALRAVQQELQGTS